VTGPNEGKDDAARGPTDADPTPAAPEDAEDTEDAAATLAREVYWAAEEMPRLPADAHSLRERLDAFTYQMRADQRQAVPVGETFLGSDAGWKRGLKQFIWRLTRFSTMRYDRLLAELAEMNGELARRLVATEEELSRLRRRIDDRDREGR
jgi:hypothetical protein